MMKNKKWESKERKFEEIETYLDVENPLKWEDWRLVKDSKVKLFTGKPILNKRGNIHHREEKVETEFRLVIIKNEKTNKEFWFLTNEFELSAKEITDYYRKRWDIEVSFRHQKYAIGGIVFHSKKLNVQQMELYTALTLYNIVSAIIQHTNIPKKKRKAMYKIKFSTAVIFCIEYLFKRGTQNLEKKL